MSLTTLCVIVVSAIQAYFIFYVIQLFLRKSCCFVLCFLFSCWVWKIFKIIKIPRLKIFSSFLLLILLCIFSILFWLLFSHIVKISLYGVLLAPLHLIQVLHISCLVYSWIIFLVAIVNAAKQTKRQSFIVFHLIVGMYEYVCVLITLHAAEFLLFVIVFSWFSCVFKFLFANSDFSPSFSNE